MATEHRDLPPRRVEVTVEWHSDRRRLAPPRRAVALGATMLIASVGAIIIADGPSSQPAARNPGIPLRCQYSEMPRVFIGDRHPVIPMPVHVPGCP